MDVVSRKKSAISRFRSGCAMIRCKGAIQAPMGMGCFAVCGGISSGERIMAVPMEQLGVMSCRMACSAFICHQFLKLMFRPGGLAELKGRRRRFSGGKVFGKNTGTLWVRMIFPESPAGAPTLPHREKAFGTFARQFLQALRCWNIRGAGFFLAFMVSEDLSGTEMKGAARQTARSIHAHNN